jgi:hypothetical protein
VPAGFTARVTGRGEVSLSWNRLVEADGYRIARNDTTVRSISPQHFAGSTTLATSAIDSLWPGTYRYQIQAVYHDSFSKQAAEAVSALSPAVSVVIPASSKVRYCQTRSGRARCFQPEIPSVTLAARKLP